MSAVPRRQRKRDDRKSVQSYLPGDHVSALDQLADESGMSRAYWIAEAVRQLLVEKGRIPNPSTTAATPNEPSASASTSKPATEAATEPPSPPSTNSRPRKKR